MHLPTENNGTVPTSTICLDVIKKYEYIQSRSRGPNIHATLLTLPLHNTRLLRSLKKNIKRTRSVFLYISTSVYTALVGSISEGMTNTFVKVFVLNNVQLLSSAPFETTI